MPGLFRRLLSRPIARDKLAASVPTQSAGHSCPEATEDTPRKFRCTDPSNIPEELLRGPFQEIELSRDVYTTSYLIARNATPDMYTIRPWINHQVRVVWAYLLFVILSQSFVISVITFFSPMVTKTENLHVNCENNVTVAWLHNHHIISSATILACKNEGKFLWQADVRGSLTDFHCFEHAIPFYNSVWRDGGLLVNCVRLTCCSWVFAFMYFEHFVSVQKLVRYHDFSCWFLPLKHHKVTNSWAIAIAIAQYFVLLVVTTVSFCIIFAQSEPFEIVMDSLAFTFIAEVGSYFNEPLVKCLAATKISSLDASYGDTEIFYLYPECNESNVLAEDGTYSDEGWYICDDEEKAGLLGDYKVRHNPSAYPHRHEIWIKYMKALMVVTPPCAVGLLGLRSFALEHGGQIGHHLVNGEL
eukprot:TRINITY_DN44638_c0_g1_i1.p1 TRINITY_DN44638_c0_g1~~TRINITY_DN44638_c0_g1_i1.p1  ORF type:complete len:435 (+),score=37.34 TRINITY_DN44638_c0_g1_i1:64-1305(+)